MGLALPEARFLGVDASERAIAAGRALVEALGLTNVTLEVAAIEDLELASARFDYVVAHGVYSWVAEPVRDRLLQLCRSVLSDRGIAYVSYNALPGGRLSGALGMTLSELIARAEHADSRVARAADQPTWTDPDTGYTRRAVSPAAGGPLELVEVTLPAGASVAYPADTYAFIHQQMWVLEGVLHFHEGDCEHVLEPGDCLQFGAPADCVFANPAQAPCRYLVALTRR